MITLRKATDRFHSQIGWLDSWHTFSFADHYDPSFLGFGALRELGVEPPHRRQMQPAQQPVEVDRGRGDGGHAPAAIVRASCVRTYSAPMAPWSTPQASACISDRGP